MEMELRIVTSQLEANSDGSLTVSGYVNKTDQLSNILGVTKKFVEKIAKGAFTRAIQSASRDIEFLAEHKKDLILASTRNGSLELTEDEQGLFMRAIITPTSWGKDYYELINSGIHRNMSFGFRTIKDKWKLIEPNLYERTIEELELFEVSVVKDPAYSQSTIAARGIDLVEEVKVPSKVELSKNRIEDSVYKKEERKSNMKTVHYYGQPAKESEEKEQRKAEYKQVESYLRGEERALNHTGNGTSAIPQNVHQEIIKKLEETAPVFGRSRKFPTLAGSLKIPRENSTDQAGFVGEGRDVTELALSFGEVKLEQKRVGASISLTNMLINDSGVNIVDYVSDLLSRRVGKTIEASIFTGNTEEEFRGIVHDTDVKEVNVVVPVGKKLIDSLKIEDLLDLYNTIHPDYLTDSAFYIQRDVFNVISKMKDEAGHFYMQNGYVNGKLTYTLFGAEIIVTNSLTAENPIVFGNVGLGYAVMVKGESGLQMITDTKNALAGTKMFIYDMYVDGAVFNPEALAKLTVSE
ncbi:phage major capsid protein [Peribacillus sp. NPDC097198]|uniref:phage major capsid protein n=1 Tax=Peribacillus sp. NPDC097198 TaxID=3364397 RepID=UPI0037F73FDB